MITDLSFYDNDKLISSSRDCTIKFWDVNKDTIFHKVRCHIL